MSKEDTAHMGTVQEEVRERLNPEWKQQLKMHTEVIAELGAGPGENVFSAFVRWKREGRAASRGRKGRNRKSKS